ncbi:GIY-YIG nuclease family protein [Gordonia sp. NPDC003425]
MGYLYAFRLGESDLFKIGQTSGAAPDNRKKSLQTGCPYPLTLFGSIETDDYKAAEKYIKEVRSDRRETEGGKEFYRLTGDEAAQTLHDCEVWLSDELPKERKANELQTVVPDAGILPADEGALELKKRWLELEKQAHSLKVALAKIESDKGRLETRLKLAIGTASGITGIATWKVVERHRISPKLVKGADPDLYEQCLVKRFSSSQLKLLLKNRDDEFTYEAFQEVSLSRIFRMIE